MNEEDVVIDTLIDEIQQVTKNAICLYDNDAVERAIIKIAVKLSEELRDTHPIILAVMSGGMVPLGKLLTHLQFPLQVDYCHATRYRNTTIGSALEWKVTPHLDLKNRTVLVVDDILDEGFTLSEVVKYCEKQGAKDVRSFVVVEKKHNRKNPVGFKANYVALQAEDHYLFGYGMDYKSYLRNADGIFAVSDSDLKRFVEN